MEDKTQNTGAAQGAAPATLEEALVLIAQYQTVNQEFATALNDSKEVISELKEQLQAAKDGQADRSALPVIEVDGVKYQVNHGAKGYGTAVEISKNEEAVKKLLAIDGQNVISKLK